MRATAYILTLRDFVRAEPSLEEILRVTSEVTRIPVKEMTAHRRPELYSRARMIFYYVATVLTSHKSESIGAILNRERSTSSHGKCVVERNMARFEPELSRVLSRFQQQRQAA